MEHGRHSLPAPVTRAAEVCPVELRDEQLREALLVRYRAERIELTTPGRIDRLISSARATFEDQFCKRTVSRLSELSGDRLNNPGRGRCDRLCERADG